MSEGKKGFIKGAASIFGKAARGALGGEFIDVSKQLAHTTKDTFQTKSCPRCFELSLAQAGENMVCQRSDICGWHGTQEDYQHMLHQDQRISHVVYALAKGVHVDVAKALQTNRFFSWLLWCIVGLMLLYAFYLCVFHTLFMAVWVLMVAVLFGLHAIRAAYRAQYLLGEFRSSPKEFLLYPRLWFVVG